MAVRPAGSFLLMVDYYCILVARHGSVRLDVPCDISNVCLYTDSGICCDEYSRIRGWLSQFLVVSYKVLKYYYKKNPTKTEYERYHYHHCVCLIS